MIYGGDSRSPDPEMIGVSLVEDDDEIREGLGLLIGSSDDLVLVASYPDCEQAIRHIGKEKPDVLLMDITLPGMSGIEGAGAIRRMVPSVDIIMLTVHEDDELVFESLCAGATGYLLKTTPPASLLQAIREVRSGGAPMSSMIARKIVDSFRRTPESPLTDRETEVLSLLCKGHSYRTIGTSLFVSEQTVHFHIKNIYQKLHVHSKSEAVAKALRERLI